MSSTSDLDDLTKTCIYLPKSLSSSDGPRARRAKARASTQKKLNHGYNIQLEAYEVAWNRCLTRVQARTPIASSQAVVRDLQTPIVSEVKTSIDDAYTKDVLAGLPYAELPVVAVSAPGGSFSVISDVITLLEYGRKGDQSQNGVKSKRGKGKARMIEDEDDMQQDIHSLVAHVHPSDCVSVANVMKMIISGFVDRQEDEVSGLDIQLPAVTKRKPATSVATFDINLLKAWYKALSQLNVNPPQLVVVLHDFEQLNPQIMQDVFYICSKNIPQLPLVFLLGSSAPSTMSYLHTAYSRATIALLRARVHTAPSGLDLANSIIEKIFFDPDFEPDIILGSAALDFLADFSSRHTPSLDAIVTILQIIHIRHFIPPLTTFVHGFDSDDAIREAATRIQQTASFSLADDLLTRLWGESAPREPHKELPEYLQDVDWSNISLEAVLALLNSARSDFRERAARTRLGYQVVRIVQKFMHAQSYRTTLSAHAQEDPEMAFMSRIIRGRAGRDIKHLALMISKLRDDQLNVLLGAIYELFHRLQNAELRQREIEARQFLVQARANIPQEATLPDDPHTVSKASAVGSSASEWFLSFVEDHLAALEQQPLWEIWSTGGTPFPSELINPAPRVTIVNALLHPFDVVNAHRTLYTSGSDETGVGIQNNEQTDENLALWELPDTSILFRRYMEAGRLINVYDLYESFAVVLETQKEKHATPATPRKKGKGKQRAIEENEESQEDAAEEAWMTEVHARFMRALHELDYMGFVKHTGRKADHIFRTVYDLPE